jgi:SOS-response transcriptional repressor LexA
MNTIFDIMTEKQEEILRLIDTSGLNKSWIAGQVGVSKQTLGNQINKNQEIDYDLYLKIKSLLQNIDLQKGSKVTTSFQIGENKPAYTLPTRFNTFPVVSKVRAGTPNGIHEGDIIDNITFNYPSKDGVLAVLVEGESMADELHHGDIVLIDKYADVQNGNIVIAIFENETHTIKRYRELKEDLIELYPNNKSFQTLITERSKLRAIYKVVRSLSNH